MPKSRQLRSRARLASLRADRIPNRRESGRIPTSMGVPQPKPMLVRERYDLCVDTTTRREDSSLAASARTGKGRLIDNVLQIYWIFDKEAPSGMAVAPNFRTPLTNVTGRSRCRRINVAVIGVDLVF